jgi:hypothetical protein
MAAVPGTRGVSFLMQLAGTKFTIGEPIDFELNVHYLLEN